MASKKGRICLASSPTRFTHFLYLSSLSFPAMLTATRQCRSICLKCILFSKRHFASKSRQAPATLADFLALSKGKDQTTATFRGTLFEWQTREALQTAFGMRLKHVGGKSDRGVDLRGEWPLKELKAVRRDTQQAASLPDISPTILAQCKNVKSGCTPDHVRALIGTIMGYGEFAKDTLGIMAIAGYKNFTKDVVSQFMASPVPLSLAKIDGTLVQSLIFNHAADELLKGLTVTTHFDSRGHPCPSLLCNGHALQILPTL